MKLSALLSELQDGIHGRFGVYLSGTAEDRTKTQPMVLITHKVLCGDESIEIGNWVFAKYDPVLHNPQIRRMTPVFIRFAKLRALKNGSVGYSGAVEVVEMDKTAASAALPASGPAKV